MDGLLPHAKRIGLMAIAAGGYIAGYFSTSDLLSRFFETAGSEAIIAVVYIVILSLAVIGLFIFREAHTSRKEKYANVTEMLHNISHTLRNLQSLSNHQTPDAHQGQQQVDIFVAKYKDELRDVLDNVSRMFSMKTGTRCRACIKTISRHSDGQLYVDTLARDKSSTKRWAELDNHRINTNHDSIDENPQFKELFSSEPHRWHYLCNNLMAEKQFSTTSITAYQRDAAKRTYTGSIRERMSGPLLRLPYRSTLTCAIRQQQIEGVRNTPDVVGFLCVDSESRNVFSERWDVQLCFAVADALFHPVDNLLKTMSAAEEHNHEKVVS